MIDKDTITHRHWSLKVGRADPAVGRTDPGTQAGAGVAVVDIYGEVVLGLDDLHQSIANIVLTPKGSVPTEPEKGVDILGAIDKHPDIGIPILTREITDALSRRQARAR